MKRLMMIIGLSFIINALYSQKEQEILNQALQSYRKELPKLENQAFKELLKLDKSKGNPGIHKFNDYCFVIIPMFKLQEKYVQYHIGDTFANYIDFQKARNDFEAFIFKDTIFIGSLHFSDYDNSCFLVNDVNRYNKLAFNGQYNLAKQIINFKPDIVFYPECPMFLCFLKEGKLYIGRGVNQLQTLDYILPVDEFIKKNPSFIKELKDNRNIGLKHYKKF